VESSKEDYRRKILELSRQIARDLVQLQPPGCFTVAHFQQAKRALDAMKKYRDSDSVDLILSLWDRLVAELVLMPEHRKRNDWVGNPRYYTHLLNVTWKVVAKQQQQQPPSDPCSATTTLSPKQLLHNLQIFVRQLETFRYNIVTIGIIMDVAIHQATTSEAPSVAEEYMSFIQNHYQHWDDDTIVPNTFIYNQILEAWALSGREEDARKMEGILVSMRKDGISPDVVTYNILLRFWGSRNSEETILKVEEILDTMTQNNIAKNMITLNEAIYVYAKVKRIESAEKLLHSMLDILHENASSENQKLVCESAQQILLAYRNIVHSKTTRERKHTAVKRATDLVELLENYQVSDDVALIGTLMDILALNRQTKTAERLACHPSSNAVHLNIWLKSMVKKPNRATIVLKSMVSDGRVRPDIISFNTLINIWVRSSVCTSLIKQKPSGNRLIQRLLLIISYIRLNPILKTL
jgi:hypothetical protein